MKKTDIALIIIIVSISAGLAWWVASVTIGKTNEQPIIVRTIDGIKVDEGSIAVDERVFSPKGINPTVEASISGEDLTSFIDAEEPESADAPDTPEGLSPEDNSQPISGE